MEGRREAIYLGKRRGTNGHARTAKCRRRMEEEEGGWRGCGWQYTSVATSNGRSRASNGKIPTSDAAEMNDCEERRASLTRYGLGRGTTYFIMRGSSCDGSRPAKPSRFSLLFPSTTRVRLRRKEERAEEWVLGGGARDEGCCRRMTRG